MTESYTTSNPQSWGKASGPRAGFWRRVAAYIIDGIIIGVIDLILGLILRHAGIGNFIGILVSAGYITAFEGSHRGAGPGKLAMGIRVVDSTTGGPIGYPRAFVRWIGNILCTIPILLGFFWMLWDSERQCWNDKLAGDYVVPTADYPVMPPGQR